MVKNPLKYNCSAYYFCLSYVVRLNELTNQLTLKERELVELKQAHSRLQKERGGHVIQFSISLYTVVINE